MNDKDKWSAHLEYLKVAITLSTAILAVAAAIYSDPSKIPQDISKYMLLLSAICVFTTLVSSITAIIYLCNYLIRPNPDPANPANTDEARARKITKSAGVSFYSLIVAGFFILLFFAVRTFYTEATIPAFQAIETVSSILKGQINSQTESLILNSSELKGNDYILNYTVTPNNIKFQALVNVANGQIEWLKRQQP